MAARRKSGPRNRPASLIVTMTHETKAALRRVQADRMRAAGRFVPLSAIVADLILDAVKSAPQEAPR